MLTWNNIPEAARTEEQWPVTAVILQLTPVIGQREISEATVGEFCARMKVLQDCDGPMLVRDGKPSRITDEDIKLMVGTSFNVSPITRAKWLKQFVGNDMDRHAARTTREYGPERVA